MFWLKNNKIITKGNKLVDCTHCPCGNEFIIFADCFTYDNGVYVPSNKPFWFECPGQTIDVYPESYGTSSATAIEADSDILAGTLTVTTPRSVNEYALSITIWVNKQYSINNYIEEEIGYNTPYLPFDVTIDFKNKTVNADLV